MEILAWVGDNWFNLLQTIAVVAGLFATAYSINENTRSRKVENAIALTNSHRELWTTLVGNPSLKRVLDPAADVITQPPSAEEEIFVQMLILHVRTALKARETKLEFGDEDMATDIREVFSLPVPRFVWNETRRFHGACLIDAIDGSKPTATFKNLAP